MKNIALIVLLMCVWSCVGSGEDGSASGASHGSSSVLHTNGRVTIAIPAELKLAAHPDSVCGLPTQCQPYWCQVDSDFLDCFANSVADQICDDACGSLVAHCPSNNVQSVYNSCLSSCSGSLGPCAFRDGAGGFTTECLLCVGSCIQNKRTSCQTGGENA